MLLTLKNIWRLGIKELWSLWRDPVMLILIVYTFTASVYTAASAMPETLHHAPIASSMKTTRPCRSASPRRSTRRTSCHRNCCPGRRWMRAWTRATSPSP